MSRLAPAALPIRRRGSRATPGPVSRALVSMVGIGLLASVLLSCGSSGRVAAVPSVLRAADIPAAVAAVEAARGRDVRFTEINVTPDGVNLFVASDAVNEVSFFYSKGVLGPPGAPAPLSGAAFALLGVALDRGPAMIATSERRIVGSLAVGLSLVQAPRDGLGWIVRVLGPKGGFRDEYYDPAGSFRYVDLETSTDGAGTTTVVTGTPGAGTPGASTSPG